MCFPALIPIAIGAGMGLMQGMAGRQQADQQAADLRQNAFYLNQAADDSLARGRKDSDWQRVETQAAIGTQRAAQAASGGVVDQDSNMQLTLDTAQLGELDALTIANNAAREAYGYQVQAATGLKNATQLQSNAKRAMTTSILGGALQGAGSSFGGGMFGSAAGAGAGTQAAMAGGTSRLNYNQAFA